MTRPPSPAARLSRPVRPGVRLPPVLAARDLVKRFGGVAALGGVSLELRAGEVHALCGENGAGKSTLIKLLSGVHPHGSYDGEILVDGQPVAFRSTRDAERAGIAIVHQELALFDEMSVAENLFLADLPQRFGRIDWDEVQARARRLLDDSDIVLDPAAKVGDLGVGQRQLVEIARALARRPRVLVLDEPTAALARREIDLLLDTVRRLRRQGRRLRLCLPQARRGVRDRRPHHRAARRRGPGHATRRRHQRARGHQPDGRSPDRGPLPEAQRAAPARRCCACGACGSRRRAARRPACTTCRSRSPPARCSASAA